MVLYARDLIQGTITTRSEPVPAGASTATATLTGDVPAGAILTLEARDKHGWSEAASNTGATLSAPIPRGADRFRVVVDLPRPASVGVELSFDFGPPNKDHK